MAGKDCGEQDEHRDHLSLDEVVDRAVSEQEQGRLYSTSDEHDQGFSEMAECQIVRDDQVRHCEDRGGECVERKLARHVGVFLAEHSAQHRAAEEACADDSTDAEDGDGGEPGIEQSIRFFARFVPLGCGREDRGRKIGYD